MSESTTRADLLAEFGAEVERDGTAALASVLYEHDSHSPESLYALVPYQCSWMVYLREAESFIDSLKELGFEITKCEPADKG